MMIAWSASSIATNLVLPHLNAELPARMVLVTRLTGNQDREHARCPAILLLHQQRTGHLRWWPGFLCPGSGDCPANPPPEPARIGSQPGLAVHLRHHPWSA